MTALAAVELRRLSRNVVFLFAVGITAYGIWDQHRAVVSEVNTIVWLSAIFIGGFGMMAMYWQTRSTQPSAEILDVAPTSKPARTAALCTLAVVPFVFGVLAMLAIIRFQPVPGPQVWGTYGRSVGLFSQMAMPALGGPLLGVALGRWVRFPGAAFVVFMVLYGWVSLTYILSVAHGDSWPFRTLRLLAPFTFFTTTDEGSRMETFRGSPGLFIGWQACLCAIAVLVALLRGADGRLRRHLSAGLVGALVAAAVTLGLTVAL